MRQQQWGTVLQLCYTVIVTNPVGHGAKKMLVPLSQPPQNSLFHAQIERGCVFKLRLLYLVCTYTEGASTPSLLLSAADFFADGHNHWEKFLQK